jgi:hypothetical protein
MSVLMNQEIAKLIALHNIFVAKQEKWELGASTSPRVTSWLYGPRGGLCGCVLPTELEKTLTMFLSSVQVTQSGRGQLV